MSAVLLGFVISVAGGAAIGVAVLLRGRSQIAMHVALEERMAGAERRLREEQERTRRGLELAIRDAARGAQQAWSDIGTDLRVHIERVREESALAVRSTAFDAQTAQTSNLREARRAQDQRLDRLETTLRELQDKVEMRLEAVRADASAQLERIRTTVDEKLSTTLETRLGESFRLVSDRLDQLHQGLGEMQSLAHGVGDFKKVLTNVRTRGTFGEVQLGALLEQVLAPEQYAANVAPIPGRSERVEYAIRLPGREDSGQSVLLPIDAKFPLADYQRLQDAYDQAEPEAAESARRALRTRLLEEAKTIRDKYLAPPHTTDFAIMFLPTEGLYAEALRIPGLVEEMQTTARIVVVGPTTLFAVLSSLQMGFRTLAIEKRSSEVWTILSAVKTEFAKFGKSLDVVSKKLQEAGNKIAETSQRSRVMERKLRAVEALPEAASQQLLLAVSAGARDAAVSTWGADDVPPPR